MHDAIFDANSLYARAFYAAQALNPAGTDTLRLAASMVLGMLHPYNSKIGVQFDRSLFCWDAQTNDAKKRKAKPPEYYEMMAIAKDMFAMLLGTTNVEQAPYEGDDLVASASWATGKDDEAYIVSGDKDLMQLVGPQSHYYSLNMRCVLSPTFVCSKFFVKRPIHIALALAVQGDPADCIQGVHRWGPAKVKKLFSVVSSDMQFEQVLSVLESQMDADQCDQFYAALERTLLKTDIVTPAPAPITFPSADEVEALGIPEIAARVGELKALYSESGDYSPVASESAASVEEFD